MIARFWQFVRQSKAMQAGLALTVVSLALYLIGLLTPLNTGVPRAPGRIVLYYLYAFMNVGLILMMWAWFAFHKTWLVPWYEEGMRIEIFSSSRVVRIALIAAATIVFAFVKIPVLGWSIRTVAPVFGGLYFGLLEGVVGGWVGYIISTLVVGGYESPLVTLPTWGIGDGVVVALSSIIYWGWIREEPSAKTRTWRYAVMLIGCFIIWYINIILESIGYLGASVILPYAVQYLAGGLIVLATIVIIAISAVEALRRTGRRGGTPGTTT